jgi:hypothetical protein
MFGDNFEGWVGKRVTLHAEPVMVSGKMQPGIRVTGSPDIEKPLTVKIKLAKRKAVTVKLIQTQVKGGNDLKEPPSPEERQEQEPQTTGQEQ